MATEQELKKISPAHKEFQALLDAEFKDKKVKVSDGPFASFTGLIEEIDEE